MASLASYTDSPGFINDTEVSATDLNVLIKNAEAIKTGALISSPIHSISRVLFTYTDEWLWRGGFQYRTGMTTAHFIIYSKLVSGGGSLDIVIKFNDVEVDRFDARIGGTNVGGTATRDIAINTRSYADYEIVTVEVIVAETSTGSDATKNVYYVYDAYVYPLDTISGIGSWTGKPTFGTIDETRLNQLSDGLDYLANRIALVGQPIHATYVNWMGTNNPKYPVVEYFRVNPTNSNPLFRTTVYYVCHEVSSYIRVTINGVNYDYGPYTDGQNTTIPIEIDLIAAGLSYGTDYVGSISEYIVTPRPAEDDGSFVFSRIFVGPLLLEASSYSTDATPSTFALVESIAYSDVKSRLNAVATIVDTAHSNMVTQSRVYNRQQMVRAKPGFNKGQNEYWNTTLVPAKYRQGDLLWVKGSGVSIGYGPISITIKSDSKPNDIWEYKFAFEEKLLDGDKISQSYFYLDQFKGLYPGMIYYILGDCTYAAEHYR